LRNRIVVSPMCQYLAVDGVAGGWHMAHHARFALGGVGACIVEATAISEQGRITHGCTGLYTDAQEAALGQIAALHAAQGVIPGIQISHAGGKGATQRPWEGAGPCPEAGPESAWETIGASETPIRTGFRPPRPARAEELAQVVEDFAKAARRAVRAGYRLIEIHGAHGYLIHQFLSPIVNQRTDSYGGAIEGRMKLALEVAEAVRACVPDDVIVAWRASVVDNLPGGLSLEDSIALCQALRERGVDLIDCSAGGIGAPVSLMQNRVEHGFQVPLAEAVGKATGLAAMAVGLITDPVKANAIVAEGRADLVALARELIADPNWAYRAAIALGHPNPEATLPAPYAFFLERRAQAQGR
jgi:2,4-dienoyl-CoA reductase-like NADH-dependent reductase (Old Yellow Enzyme family)